MNRFQAFITILLFISLASSTNAQEKSAIYGLDPLLYNGRNYSFSLSNETIGHPFLHTQTYESGYVVIRNEKFEDILLNYDIYNQELILKYQDLHGADNLIKLSKAWLRSFYLNNNEFVSLETENGQERFFQVIGRDSLKILYHWEKKMSLSKEVGKSNYHFSEPGKVMYLFRNEVFYRFKNNNSFIEYFEPGQKDLIKIHLAQYKINVKKASDESMLNLINYCNHLRN
jgi:hypothetical protein